MFTRLLALSILTLAAVPFRAGRAHQGTWRRCRACATNQLIGYGLVVGLDGRRRSNQYRRRSPFSP